MAIAACGRLEPPEGMQENHGVAREKLDGI